MEAVEDLHASVHRLFARDGGLHPPLHVIQSWPRPNFVDPEERGWDAPIALIVVMVLVFIVYFARMWARLGVGRNAGVDDLLMSIAMVPLLGLSISVILGRGSMICLYCLLTLSSHQKIRLPVACMGSD